VLLEKRAATNTVMPGMWELPLLPDDSTHEDDLRFTVRHAIMQVNYVVRVCEFREEDVARLKLDGGERRWVSLGQAAGMALTGLARKVLGKVQPGSAMKSTSIQL
jgi:A/G-specific adenine glycosylase